MNTRYLLVEQDTGAIAAYGSIPSEMFPPANVRSGLVVVRALDNRPPPIGEHRVLARHRKFPVNAVATFAKAFSAWRPPQPKADARLAMTRSAAIEKVDLLFADLLAKVTGPLVKLHAEKRRQAEAGGGPLVTDETDRLAILANAAAEDEAVARIERRRRTIKAALKAATTEEEITAALAMPDANDAKEALT